MEGLHCEGSCAVFPCRWISLCNVLPENEWFLRRCVNVLTNNENADERVMSVRCLGASIVHGCLDKRENTDERVMSVSCPGASIVLGCLDKREKYG